MDVSNFIRRMHIDGVPPQQKEEKPPKGKIWLFLRIKLKIHENI